MRQFLVSLCCAVCLLGPDTSHAQRQYDRGATDHEILLGQTMPYSGPASGLGVQGGTDVAYFRMINARGGINGRLVTLVSLDDGYSPPRALEQTRKLVEHDQVLAIYHSLGTPTNSATYKYVNGKRIPHLFIVSGAEKFRDARGAPWTTTIVPPLVTEGRALAAQILSTSKTARIGVLYQNDDFGKDLLKGLRLGLGTQANSMIIAEASYEITDPTVDSQIVMLKDKGAQVLMLFGVPRFSALALRKAHTIGWTPIRYVAAPSSNVATVMRPLGRDIATGIMAVKFIKDPSDPTWHADPGMKEYKQFLRQWRPEADPADFDNAFAYVAGQIMKLVIERCGDQITRANLMKQALSLRDVALPMLMPGIRLNTSESRRSPIEQFQVVQYDGEKWIPIGGLHGH